MRDRSSAEIPIERAQAIVEELWSLAIDNQQDKSQRFFEVQQLLERRAVPEIKASQAQTAEV